jgi:hypothetical protein
MVSVGSGSVARSATNPGMSSVVSTSLSSLIFAFLPKCPACLVLMLAPFGVRLPGSKLFLAYTVLLLAAIPLVFFMSATCRKSLGYKPMFLALAGLGVMSLGRVVWDSTALVAIGATVMFGSALWTARFSVFSQKKTECGSFRGISSQRCES